MLRLSYLMAEFSTLAEALRVARLSQRLQESSKRPTVSEAEEGSAEKDTAEDGEAMQVEESAKEEGAEGAEGKKVSTHGPRMSGREVWKAKKKGGAPFL